jgi:hypothetical protein
MEKGTPEMKLQAVALLFVGLIAPAALADHSPLDEAASCYRDVVRRFEQHVQRVRYIEPCDERLVDDLEDASGDFRSAARHPEDLSRLLYTWETVSSLQARVELALFRRGNYPCHPLLEQCWQEVVVHYGRLAALMDGFLAPCPVHSFRPPQEIRYRYDQYRFPAAVTPNPAGFELPSTNANPWGFDAYRRGFGRAEVSPRGAVAPPRGIPSVQRPADPRDPRAVLIGALLSRIME